MQAGVCTLRGVLRSSQGGSEIRRTVGIGPARDMARLTAEARRVEEAQPHRSCKPTQVGRLTGSPLVRGLAAKGNGAVVVGFGAGI